MGSWNEDGVIVFGTRGSGALSRVSASGGIPAAVTALDSSRGELFHAFPVFLPDGRRFVYYRQSTTAEHQGLYAGSLDAGREQQSTSRIVAADLGNSHVDVAPSGDLLLFIRQGSLMAQPFDLDRLVVSGEPAPVVQSVGSTGSFGFFSASRGGVVAYRRGRAFNANVEQLTWVDRGGNPVAKVGEPRPHAITAGSVALAPDLGRAAVSVAPSPAPDLWIVEFARGIATRFTFHPGSDFNPIWSPDGRRIVFRSQRV